MLFVVYLNTFHTNFNLKKCFSELNGHNLFIFRQSKEHRCIFVHFLVRLEVHKTSLVKLII